MKLMTTAKKRKPRNGGNAIMELPAGLLVLFLFVLFPMIDIISVGVKYASCYTLNSLQSREAALLPATVAVAAAGPIKKSIPDNWRSMGIGRFCELAADPETTVKYVAGHADQHTGFQDEIVVVTTKVSVQPFLTVPTPGLANLPGLNAPMTFVISSERPMENCFNAKK